MKKRLTIWVLVLALCLTAAVPALAGDMFVFTEKEIALFEGNMVQTELKRGGNYDGDGEIVYSSFDESIATISEGGVITGVKKGRTQVAASLMRDGKRVIRTLATVTVRRAVTKVTLNTTKLSVYEPDDPAVIGLLKEPAEPAEDAERTGQEKHQVLVIPAGTTVTLTATCTPTDANSQKVKFTSSDAGVARISDIYMKAIQRGECELTVASVLNPEVTETFRVLVIQPVRQIKIDAGTKKVAAGSTLQLTAECLPDNATIPEVTWSSRTPTVATVDENGVVTGLKRGTAGIVATAADGSRVEQAVSLVVTQPVTDVTITESEIPVIVGRNAYARVKVLPADATDKSVTWSVSDTSIATVSKGGMLTGVKAGECLLIATSNSNPEVTSVARVVVSQLVTKVENVNNKEELSLRVGESVQTRWNILPEDATVKALTFKSNYPGIASVDENGVVHALRKGVATITATAKDSGRRQGTVKITVIQPVTGVSIQYPLYYIQSGSYRNLRAIVEPKNANNQSVIWSSDNNYVASATSNGTSTGRVNGNSGGTTTIYARTEDGGFTAATQVKVGDYDHAIRIEDLYINGNNEIKIVLRNVSDVNIRNVHMTIACYDENEQPFVCNTDEESMYFEADYPYLLMPYDRTVHGYFHFKNWKIDRPLGAVVLTIVNWKDDNGIQFPIPEYDRPRTQWIRRLYQQTQGDDGVG